MRILPYTSNILISLAAGSSLNLNQNINNTWGVGGSHFSKILSINNETLFEAVNQENLFP